MGLQGVFVKDGDCIKLKGFLVEVLETLTGTPGKKNKTRERGIRALVEAIFEAPKFL